GAAIDEVGPTFVAPLWRQLAELDVDRVVFVPTGGVGLIPLNDLADRASTPAAKVVETIHAPSATVRNAALRRADASSGGGRFVAGANRVHAGALFPRGEGAAEQAAASFGNSRVLTGFDATRQNLLQALEGAEHVHFACHGKYDLNQPLASYLVLSEDSVLT